MTFAQELFLRKILVGVIEGSMGARWVNIPYWEEPRIGLPKPWAYILAVFTVSSNE